MAHLGETVGALSLLSSNKAALEVGCRPLLPESSPGPLGAGTQGSTLLVQKHAVKAVPSVSQSLHQESADGEPNTSVALRERLDFKPRLSILDVIACVIVPAAICASLYFGGLRPAKWSPMYAVGIGMIYVAWVAILRAVLLERHYAKRLVTGEDLGDADSKFPSIEGLKVHAKVFKPTGGPIKALMHCFHGFGANVESWDSVQCRIAQRATAVVSSHDKPGFGLTERPADPHKYSSQYNGAIGQAILDTEAASLKSISQANEGKLKKVLVGHSMGAGSAAAIAISHPQDIDGLILVAPAIMVLGFLVPQHSGKPGTFASNGSSCTVQFDPELAPGMSLERPAQKNRLQRLLYAVITVSVAKASKFLELLLAPFTVISLRAAVRSRAFWENGLGRAWFDRSKLTPKIVDAYRKPQLVKGWERGLVNFTSSRLGGTRSMRQVFKDAWSGRQKPLQAEDLAEAVAKHNIKVLIVHGKYDRIVPARNSRRLASLIPSARFVEWDCCGHLPHEEHPEDFIKLTEAFMSSF